MFSRPPNLKGPGGCCFAHFLIWAILQGPIRRALARFDQPRREDVVQHRADRSRAVGGGTGYDAADSVEELRTEKSLSKRRFVEATDAAWAHRPEAERPSIVRFWPAQHRGRAERAGRGVAVVPSRAELIAHWQVVGDLALEYRARRPLTLVRQVEDDAGDSRDLSPSARPKRGAG